ncbi:MAG TPA: RecX family transcriptional regulator, partial [Bacteroidota bacterium]|nr:RecX family transcriptional regulator [Bacteroidota bacterium]
ATDTLIRFGLRTGDEITEATLQKLSHAEEILAAKNAALRYLAVRPRSEREIRDALRDKEFSDQVAAETIASLKESRLLDDAAFARSYIRNAIVLKPSGRVLLRQKLLLLGVERSLAEEALDEVLEKGTELDEAEKAARGFAAKKTRARSQGPEFRKKLTAYLLRRGYSWEIVRQAAKKALEDDKGGGDEF